MRNLAGTGDTEHATLELRAAGIPTETVPVYGECKVEVQGKMLGWTFRRLWYYWSARADDGIGIRTGDVEAFDEQWGRDVRAHGYAGGGGLHVMSGPVDCFYIDTQEGLEAFVGFIKGRT